MASGVPSPEARSALVHAASARALAEAAPSIANQVPYISPISPLYLAYISPISPLPLPYISTVRPRSRTRWRPSGRRGRRPLRVSSSRRAGRRRHCRTRSVRPPAQLPYVSTISPPHLPYLSFRCVRRRGRRRNGGGGTRQSRASAAGGRASRRTARRRRPARARTRARALGIGGIRPTWAECASAAAAAASRSIRRGLGCPNPNPDPDPNPTPNPNPNQAWVAEVRTQRARLQRARLQRLQGDDLGFDEEHPNLTLT